MLTKLLLSGAVLFGCVSTAMADRGDRYRGYDRGDRYVDRGRSQSGISFSFGYSNGGYYRGDSSYFNVGYRSGGYDNSYCSTPYYYSPRPVVVERPVYIAPRPVYVERPVYVAPPVYQPAPVVVYPQTSSYYYDNCAPSGGYYRSSTTYYYYGR